eukprot:TRINITY_DN2098_c0_g1_i1.p1 TRINITY_DN2098_c0_g1~~TRINITY_DN2098_c0_g1_i1.p1  ORF type:complete len:645 (+),score=198.09 TRINITY_DN2098_c0_g1_i1:62-1936(+)
MRAAVPLLALAGPCAALWQWEGDEPVWTLANESNVYSSDYGESTVWLAGVFATEDECRTSCDGNTTCQSYTWTPGDQPGKTGCSYVHQCWQRSDDVWHPKETRECSGLSGFKGNPAPPSPSPSPSPGPTPAPPKNAMNVLFVIFDDLRPNSGAYGVPQASMPNIDALANRSIVFDHAYCNQAVCGPSRASLLSGRRPDSTQMWNFIGGFRKTPGADKWRTWPEYFRTSGFNVWAVGKLYHPDDPADFDVGRSWLASNWGGYHGQGSCAKQTSWEAPSDRHGCATSPGAAATYPDVATVATAKQYLAKAKAGWDKGVPFWLGVGIVKPHMPQAFPDEFLSHVPAQDQIVLAKNQNMTVGTSSLEWGDGAEESTWMQPFPASTQQAYRRGYYAAAAFADAKFGEVMAELKTQGLENDTVVVVTADHGWGLGEHNHWIKYTNWETDARIPLLIHHPKKPATWGTRQDAIVEHVDLYPTTAELAGIPVPSSESIEGKSYAALLDAPSDTEGFDAAYTQYPRCCVGSPPYNFTRNKRCAQVKKEDFTYMGYSLRSPEWRYTEWAVWDGAKLKPKWGTMPNATELYDHRGDTGKGVTVFDDFENENLAFKPEHAGTVSQLSKQLRAFYGE